METIIFKNWDRYEGAVAFAQPHWKGRMEYANWDIYEWMFRNWEINWEWKMIYKNGSSYEWEWDNWVYEWYWIQTLKNWRIWKWIWHNGKPVIKDAKFLIKYPNDNNWYDQFWNLTYSEFEWKNVEVEWIKWEVENPEIEELFDENWIPIWWSDAWGVF